MKDKMFEFYKNSLLGNISGEPLCDEYKKEWNKCGDDKAALVKFSLKQQCLPYIATACYQGKGLTKDFIKQEFGEFVNGYKVKDADGVRGYSYGLYVDWDYVNDLVVSMDVISVMWTVGANVVVPKVLCPTIYISNRSKVHLICDGYNTVNIKIFDESEVIIEDTDENTKVTVYRYSPKAKVETGKFCLGEVKTFEKELRL